MIMSDCPVDQLDALRLESSNSTPLESSTPLEASNSTPLEATSGGAASASNGIGEHALSTRDVGDAGGKGITTDLLNMGRPAPRVSYGVTNSDKHAVYYPMDKRVKGLCLIFNHMYFDPSLNMNVRKGTNADKEAISALFHQLGFDVKPFDDCTYDALMDKTDYYSSEYNHDAHDCLVMFFLSHGEEGVFYAKDRSFKQDDLFRKFEGDNCPSLAGKPKLFFIQACRGQKLETGIDMMDKTDGLNFSHKLPVTADVITLWSTVPGYYSWRNTTNGSWFIQSLVNVFREYGRYYDIYALHSAINRNMILDFQSNTPSDPGMHRKKQACSLVSTATRILHFFPQELNRRA